MAEEENTMKFSTVAWFLLGLIIPFWPVSLPVCWWLAYRSYTRGNPRAVSIDELYKANELLKAGAITPEEFDRLKRRTLAAGAPGAR